MAQKLRPQAETLSGSPQPNFIGYQAASIIAKRAPTTLDTGYPLGQLWVDKSGGASYQLQKVLAGSATWALLGTDSGALNTLTGDSGGAISPSAGNINVVGTSNQIASSGAGSTITWSLANTMIVPGSLEVTSGFTVDAGATTISSGTSAITISDDAAATTLKFGTGAGAKTVTVGSSNTTSTTTIACGTGGAAFGTSANAHATTLGSTTTTSATTVQSGSGALNITSTNGAMTLASGTGEIDISADAAATTVKVGTGAGAKAVTLGSTDTTSGTTISYGSGNLSIDGAAAGTVTIAPSATSATINIGGTGANIGTMTIAGGTGAQEVDIANSTGGKTVKIATGAGVNAVTVGSTNTTSTTTINSGTGGLLLKGGQVLPVTNVNNAATPYALLGTDQFVAVDPTAGVVAITLPASPATGRFLTVYDATGQAAAHTITVDGNGKNISAGGTSAATQTLTTAYQSINLWYNGTIWNAQIIT